MNTVNKEMSEWGKRGRNVKQKADVLINMSFCIFHF